MTVSCFWIKICKIGIYLRCSFMNCLYTTNRTTPSEFTKKNPVGFTLVPSISSKTQGNFWKKKSTRHFQVEIHFHPGHPQPKALVKNDWANARNVSFQSFYGGKSTLSAQLINPKFCVSRPHRRSTTVSLEPNPLALVKSFLGL